MANGFVCIHCGWQENIHKLGGFGLTAEERARMNVLRPGYTETQMQCAQSYEPSPEELAAEEQERNSGGLHEGQH